jgi:hypothetical protein
MAPVILAETSAVPAKAYEALMDKLEDRELNAIVDAFIPIMRCIAQRRNGSWLKRAIRRLK